MDDEEDDSSDFFDSLGVGDAFLVLEEDDELELVPLLFFAVDEVDVPVVFLVVEVLAA